MASTQLGRWLQLIDDQLSKYLVGQAPTEAATASATETATKIAAATPWKTTNARSTNCEPQEQKAATQIFNADSTAICT